MLNEKFLNQDNNSRDKAFFAVSLMSTLWKLKELDKVDDIYLNLNMEKLEIYIFVFEEDFETENNISEILSDWEMQQYYYPEIFINISEQKMNLLPRSVVKIC